MLPDLKQERKGSGKRGIMIHRIKFARNINSKEKKPSQMNQKSETKKTFNN
jgi:hypothetical protein